MRAAAAFALPEDGVAASHVPDLLVWRRAGPELCDVKSEERLDDPDFQAQVRATGRACAEAGVGYRVLSEPDRQLLMNVRWLAGFREPPADLDGERVRMLAVLAGGPSTIGELLSGAREVGGASGADEYVVVRGGDGRRRDPIGAESRVWARRGRGRDGAGVAVDGRRPARDRW